MMFIVKLYFDAILLYKNTCLKWDDLNFQYNTIQMSFFCLKCIFLFYLFNWNNTNDLIILFYNNNVYWKWNNKIQ